MGTSSCTGQNKIIQIEKTLITKQKARHYHVNLSQLSFSKNPSIYNNMTHYNQLIISMPKFGHRFRICNKKISGFLKIDFYPWNDLNVPRKATKGNPS